MTDKAPRSTDNSPRSISPITIVAAIVAVLSLVVGGVVVPLMVHGTAGLAIRIVGVLFAIAFAVVAVTKRGGGLETLTAVNSAADVATLSGERLRTIVVDALSKREWRTSTAHYDGAPDDAAVLSNVGEVDGRVVIAIPGGTQIGIDEVRRRDTVVRVKSDSH